MKKVLVIDTSILCVWLQVPGKDNCGPNDDSWDYERVNQKIEQEIEDRAILVLPLASIRSLSSRSFNPDHISMSLSKATILSFLRSI